MRSHEFVIDILDIRSRTRAWMTDVVVVENGAAGSQRVVKVLNEALATELVCASRYTRQWFAADKLNSEAVKKEFLEHAAEEWAQADWIAERITQLGGRPDFNPVSLIRRSREKYSIGETLYAMLKESLVAKRIAIATFTKIAQWLNDKDPASRRLIEEILRNEQEHTEALTALLGRQFEEPRGLAAAMEPGASPSSDFGRTENENLQECCPQ
jgi:bacterioferritin